MEIALCRSGGGYRAAVFHLGVMSYLNKVNMPHGGRLLDRVHTITCISGGALPGLSYLLAMARNEDIDTAFKQLYRLLVNNGLSNPLLQDFDVKSGEKMGLIESLAYVYDDIFFHQARFGEILDYVSWDGIHHFSVDATDFELGMPFRFQATDKIENPNREEEHGVIGNKQHRIDWGIAHEIRIADIMAATSCFPLVFEPISYPNDFTFRNPDIRRSQDASYVLMDGGLVDNQGIDPALHAEYHLSQKGRNHDLLILSDAGNMNSEEENKPVKLTRVSPDCIFWIIYALMALLGIGAIVLLHTKILWAFGICLSLFAVSVALLCLIRTVERKVMRYISDKGNISYNYNFIWKHTINNILEFIRTRLNTTQRMVNVIMMGQIKKSSYQVLFNSTQWKNRIMLNSLSILSTKGRWNRVLQKRNEEDKRLKPSRAIRQNSDKANQMKTTLWFSDEEIRTRMPEAILACGQYTVCWNLLQQIDRLKATPEDLLTDGQKELIGIEGILRGDWVRFCRNPKYMTNSFREDRL